MKLADHRALLLRRALAQEAHAALAPLADAIVMLSAPGPAPLRTGASSDGALASRPTGEPVCHPECKTPSALLHTPAVTLPMMGVEGMPVGAQLVGQRNQDARMVSLACWLALEAGTVVV